MQFPRTPVQISKRQVTVGSHAQILPRRGKITIDGVDSHGNKAWQFDDH